MIWKPFHLTREQMEERRLTGGRMLRRTRRSQSEIARQLGVTRMAVSHWAKQLVSGGLRRLRRRKPTGRPAKLTKLQQKAFLRLLKRGAKVAGFRTERWTLQRIQTVIEQEFHVVYHPHYVARLLQKIDWSLQVPLPRAKERDEKLIRAWLVHDWPRIKKGRGEETQLSCFLMSLVFRSKKCWHGLGSERETSDFAPSRARTSRDIHRSRFHLGGPDLQTTL